MEISISKEAKRFEEHIDNQNNSRIFFSGIFGIGKTYFLEKFFSDNRNYEPIFLRPVNYSISSNDDIIDYIKYDISFELLSKNLEFEKSTISKYLSTEYYIKENPLEAISILAKMSGKIGKTISNIVDGFKVLKENVETYQKKVEVDEKQELISFLEEKTEKEGSIYHENRITALISLLIESLKIEEEGTKKRTVLIVDDLDRLDPEHIFRILNVFACHFDLGVSETNKFGFDKVVIVGDSENIRNIFHAKYGVNTDFNGYIDKFFSTEIYEFDNKPILKSFLYDYVPNLKVGQSLYLKDSRSVVVKLIYEILRDLIDARLLNLRTIKNSIDKEHVFTRFNLELGKGKLLSSYELKMVLIFELLLSVYGSTSALKLALEKLSKRKPSKIMNDLYILEPIICLLDYKVHKAEPAEVYGLVNKELGVSIKYSLARSGYNINLNIKEFNYIDASLNVKKDFPFAPFLYLAFQEFLSIEKANF